MASHRITPLARVGALLLHTGVVNGPGNSRNAIPEPEERGYPRDDDLYQLFVQLDGIEPHVWRRLLVSKQTELPLLHLSGPRGTPRDTARGRRRSQWLP